MSERQATPSQWQEIWTWSVRAHRRAPNRSHEPPTFEQAEVLIAELKEAADTIERAAKAERAKRRSRRG